ncbi:unnamed protein product [Candidula unifasciata]|uniref:LIM zinc-binding domain-containing protein n=1 Tax=Candidula unifasciata TaxID=100452 RepID=A0A8S3YZS9_9EUPU|nr:unnamed protein product [Candidula unifasciata]
MSDFKNLQQANVPLNAAPTVRYMWVCETTQNLGTPSNYQQQVPTMYPFNALHNSPVFASQHNFNQRPLAFPENFQTQQAFWPPSNAMFQSASNLSPVTVTGYVVANPQFLQNSAPNQANILTTNTVDITNQLFSTANASSQPVSLGLVNDGYQPEQIWFNQQGQQLQNNLQQQDQMVQNNYQQHDQLQENSLPQQDQVLANSLQQQNQLLQSHHHQQDTLLQNTHNQQDQLLQGSHHQQDQQLQNSNYQLDQQLQEQTIIPSSQQPINDNGTYYVNKNSSTQAVSVKDYSTHGNENISDKVPESVKEAQWREDSSDTIGHGSLDIRPKALSDYLPTTLNPSLQIKSSPRGKEPTSSGSSYTLSETKIKEQFVSNEPEVLLRRNDSQKNSMKEVYPKPRNKDDCIRCNTKVYPMERMGPIKDAVYHKRCFTCVSCGTTLNLKNFHHNPNEADDPSVFCASHRPKERAHSCDTNTMSIRSALTTPKLDKVNGQIRTDRHPSEVLARSGYNLPTASGLNSTQECFYYGMEVQESVPSYAFQKSGSQEYVSEKHTVYVEDHYTHFQQGNEQLERPQEEQNRQLLSCEQTAHAQKQQLQEIVDQDMLQCGTLESNMKLTADLGSLTISGKDKTSLALADNQKEDLFLYSSQNILTNENDNKDKQLSMLSLDSSILSSSSNQEISSANKFESKVTTHFVLDNDMALQQQAQDVGNTDAVQDIITRERPSSQSSLSPSSRSISPMQVQTNFSFVEIEDGRKSSSSTDLSSRERSSFSSDLSSPGSNTSGSDLSIREKIELGTRAKSYSTDQIQLFVEGVRVDRPSIHQYYHDLNTRRKTGSSDSMAEKSTSSDSLDMSRSISDRFLPKSERMRLDRPSQYSREDE